MKRNKEVKARGSRFVRAAMAGVLAFGLAPVPAFAAGLQGGSVDLGTQADAMSTDGYVIAAAYAAANPAPEILGLNNPNQRSQQEAEQTYNFFGDADINTNPDPYLWNNHNGLTPGVYIGGRQGSPMSMLNRYNTQDPTAAQNAVWELMPHIILGTGSDKIEANEHDFYIDSGDAADVETALGLEKGSYQPIGVTYNRVSLPTMIQTMYRLASAANKVTENDATLKTRYEDPMEIAMDYERYIVGQKGLVKQAIDSGKVKVKTIALVESYDSSAHTYTIITDGVAEGTATTNRYLEAVQGVTNNYFDEVGAVDAATVTADQLKDNVDVIIIGGNAGTESGSLADYLLKDGLLDRTFYCVNWANGSAFGTTVNSVENAQNIGRILPCVYPEVLDQSDMIAYYYETFYHLKTGVVADTVAARMDGVRNWNNDDSASFTTWEKADVNGYVHDDVEALLKSGISYLNFQDSETPYLAPTDNVEKDTVAVDLKEAKVTVPAGILADGKAEPEPRVTYGGAKLVKGTDYTVSYANNTTAGDTGTVTIKAVEGEGAKYTGSTSANFKIIEEDNFSNLTASLEGESFDFTGKQVTPTVTVKSGEITLVEGTDFIVTYANNVNCGDPADDNPPTATAVGIGDYNGAIDLPFEITEHETGATISAKSNYTFGDSFTVSATVDSAYSNDGGKLGAVESSNPDVIAKKTDARGNVSYVIAGVGTTTLSVSGAATDNCTAPEATKEVTVAKLGSQTVTVEAADKAGAIAKMAGDADFELKAKTNGDGKLTYASSDEKVAKVDEAGKVTLVGAGEATITVSAAETTNAGAGSKDVKLTVTKKDQTITTDAASYSRLISDAKTIDLKAATDGDGKITYASSDEKVATVDETGKVTIVGVGTAKITVTAAETDTYKAATKTIDIAVAAKAQTITASDKSVAMGKTVSLGAKTNGGGALTYKSSNDKVAKVDARGKVTPVGVGTANITITAAAKGEYAQATKTVKVTVKQGTQSLTFKNQTKKVALNKVKNAKQTVAITKAKGAKTAVTYSIVKVNKSKNSFKINKSTGKITVAKGVKKGTYKVTVKAAAAKSKNFKAASKNAVVTINVK